MEVNQQNITALSHFLKETQEPDLNRRRAAEEQLKKLAATQGFSLVLLQLLNMNDVPLGIRLSAAIYFKNFVKLHWANKEETIIPPNDRIQIKANLVNLMLSVPPQLQKQLSASLELISDSDFPKEWENLLPELVSKFGSQDFRIINGVLKTANSIFKRYRSLMKSNAVLTELKYILDIFQAPMLQLFTATTGFIEQNISNPDAVTPAFTAIKSLLKIFYSLNCIDLPEFFEDNMQTYMEMFRKFLILELKYPQLVGDEDDEKPGLLHKVQAAICQNLNLYIGKYEEEFAPFYQTFLRDIWALLMKIPQEGRYDILVTSAIQFVSSASTSVHYGLFKDPEVLKTICEKIVIPNLKLREIDIELFEDNPTEYVRRDIEGSDNDTRRRSAIELIKGLRKYFEKETTEICAAYINTMLQQYSSNPKNFWWAKDIAIFLVTALAVKGATAAKGTTEVNVLVPVVDFFASQILPELQNDNPPAMVLKADALKFVSTFRQQIPKEAYLTLFPLLIKSLVGRTSYVVQTYAASCIDKLLLVKDNGVQRLGKQDLKPYLDPALTALFQVLQNEQSKENDYIMRAIVKVISSAQEEILPHAAKFMGLLVQILQKICTNPTNPTFNHYLFEAIASILKSSSSNSQALTFFESQLFPPFQIILQMDVQEFAPYVFQILALLLESTPGAMSAPYKAILPPLLAPVLWERSGNVPALVRLLQAYLRKGAQEIVSGGFLEGVLGVFQKLIASKVHDHEGFYLLESIILYIPPSEFTKHMKVILTLVFTRLQKDKTLKFIKSFLVFLALFVGKHGPTAVIDQVDLVQPNLFLNILGSLWLPNIQKVNGVIERKMAAVAMIKLLTECPKMLEQPYSPQWGEVFKCLLLLLEEPEDESVPLDIADAEFEEQTGYTAAFSQLAHATRTDVDPFPDVQPKMYLAVSLNKISKQIPGMIPSIIQTIDPKYQMHLQSYFQAVPQLQPPYVI